jgi:hypothetical protein
MKVHLPDTLPMLPGNGSQDPKITRYHKTQLLNHKDGACLEKTKFIEEPVDETLLQSMREGRPLRMPVPERPAPENDGVPRIAPQWLKHDRQVLRFYAYFQESVIEDPNENFRIRNCVINYFLEDDTIYIYEPKVENSGLPQGVFLKRHKVPAPDGGALHWSAFDAQ